MYIPHPHIYRLTDDMDYYNWGGLIVRMKRYKCRFCPAIKSFVRGRIDDRPSS